VAKAELILKVKEPIEPEWSRIRGARWCSPISFCGSEALTKAIIKSGCIAIAYETVELPNKELPLLTPMSEVAGRMAVQEGAKYLEKVSAVRHSPGGCRGVLPAEVLILGAVWSARTRPRWPPGWAPT